MIYAIAEHDIHHTPFNRHNPLMGRHRVAKLNELIIQCIGSLLQKMIQKRIILIAQIPSSVNARDVLHGKRMRQTYLCSLCIALCQQKAIA